MNIGSDLRLWLFASFVSTAIAGTPAAAQQQNVSAVPNFKVEEGCKGMVQANKSEDLVDSESFKSCMADEAQARQQLTTIWPSFSASLRERCEGEATVGGPPSYVDLLVCLLCLCSCSICLDEACSAMDSLGLRRSRRLLFFVWLIAPPVHSSTD